MAASQSTVAVGGEASDLYFPFFPAGCNWVTQDQKVRLNHWDGKVLKETDVLEGNKGIVSALAFSPDGNLLAAGDVCDFLVIREALFNSLVVVKRKNCIVRCQREEGS